MYIGTPYFSNLSKNKKRGKREYILGKEELECWCMLRTLSWILLFSLNFVSFLGNYKICLQSFHSHYNINLKMPTLSVLCACTSLQFTFTDFFSCTWYYFLSGHMMKNHHIKIKSWLSYMRYYSKQTREI